MAVARSTIRIGPNGSDRDRLVTDNLGLVYMMLKRYFHRTRDREELVSAGMLALVLASRGFDESRGVRFNTYACSAIYNGMARVRTEEIKRSARFKSAAFEHLDDAIPVEWSNGREAHLPDGWKRQLDRRSLSIFRARFIDGKNLREIGALHRISKERVRQIIESTVNLIRAQHGYHRRTGRQT